MEPVFLALLLLLSKLFANRVNFCNKTFFEFCVLFSQLARFLSCHARSLPALSSPLNGTWVVTT